MWLLPKLQSQFSLFFPFKSKRKRKKIVRKKLKAENLHPKVEDTTSMRTNQFSSLIYAKDIAFVSGIL